MTRPEPAPANAEQKDYMFERVVETADFDGNASYGRIDVYKLGRRRPQFQSAPSGVAVPKCPRQKGTKGFETADER